MYLLINFNHTFRKWKLPWKRILQRQKLHHTMYIHSAYSVTLLFAADNDGGLNFSLNATVKVNVN